jgi:FtsZ-interacting cell division protein YlmF
MKKLFIFLLLFSFCSTETTTESFSSDIYEEEEYEEDSEEEEYEEDSEEEEYEEDSEEEEYEEILKKRSTKRILKKREKKNLYMMNTENGIKEQHILTLLHQQVPDGISAKGLIVRSMYMKACRLQMVGL